MSSSAFHVSDARTSLRDPGEALNSNKPAGLKGHQIRQLAILASAASWVGIVFAFSLIP